MNKSLPTSLPTSLRLQAAQHGMVLIPDPESDHTELLESIQVLAMLVAHEIGLSVRAVSPMYVIRRDSFYMRLNIIANMRKRRITPDLLKEMFDSVCEARPILRQYLSVPDSDFLRLNYEYHATTYHLAFLLRKSPPLPMNTNLLTM